MKLRCTPRAGKDEARGEAKAIQNAAGKTLGRTSGNCSRRLAALLRRLDQMEHRLDAMLTLLS